MTVASQHTTWLKFHAFQNKIEKRFIPLVAAPMRADVKNFIAAGLPSSKINDFIKFAPLLIPIFNNLYYKCGYGYGYDVYKQFRNVKSFSRIRIKDIGNLRYVVTPEDIARYVVNELRLSLLNNVHGIEASVKQRILDLIQQGQNEGWSFEKTAQKINDVVNIQRARRIVRTESVKAANMSAIEGAKRTGIVLDKIWISARDERVRGNPAGKYPFSEFDHWDMNGQTVPINRPFFLGARTGGSDEIDFPGAPNGSPANVINCRCVAGFIPRRDANGNVIRNTPAGSLVATV